jgi:hypothetical protein
MPPSPPNPGEAPAAPQPDFYLENGLVVFTAAFHIRRGFCCGSVCRHCPYEPKHEAGTTQVRP